jgi:hypothetical protein
VRRAPDLAQEVGVGQHLAGIRGQLRQQREFLRGGVDPLLWTGCGLGHDRVGMGWLVGGFKLHG